MADVFTVDVSELTEFGKQMVAAAASTHKMVMRQIGNLGEFVKFLCRIELADVRYTGALEESFVVEMRPADLAAWVYPTAGHAMYMRMGTRPHWAPIGPLKRWAAVKLGDEKLAYPVQRSIATYGTSVWQLRKRGTMANPWPERVMRRADLQQALRRTAEGLGMQIVTEIFS